MSTLISDRQCAMNALHSRTFYIQSESTIFSVSDILRSVNIQSIRISAENSANARKIFIVGDFAPRWRRFISASLRSSNLTARRWMAITRFINVKMSNNHVKSFLPNCMARRPARKTRTCGIALFFVGE